MIIAFVKRARLLTDPAGLLTELAEKSFRYFEIVLPGSLIHARTIMVLPMDW